MRLRRTARILLTAVAVSLCSGVITYYLVVLAIDGSLPRAFMYKEPEVSPEDQERYMQFAPDVALVYTWVNGSVPEYYNLRKRHGGDGAVGTSRDRENDELRHSLRSVMQFMPWHRGMIYIVSPLGMAPYWLNLSHPRIKIVAQESLLPEKDNPTFNSNAIEQHLWRIPGLSDLFVHMNDDYFLGREVQPWHLFTVDGGTRFFFEGNVIHGGEKDAKTNYENRAKIWLSSVYHTNGLLHAAYGRYTRYFLKHAPFVYRRESMRRMQEKWPEAFALTSASKFRHWFDVITPLAHHYYVVHEGSKCCGDTHELAPRAEMDAMTGFVIVEDETKLDASSLKQLMSKRPRFITINDNFSKSAGASVVRQWADVMFPLKSPFERDDLPDDHQ